MTLISGISYRHPNDTIPSGSLGDCEIFGEFPRIHSKHWSFCVLDDHKRFEVKQTALTRLISYHEYKRLYEQKLPS